MQTIHEHRNIICNIEILPQDKVYYFSLYYILYEARQCMNIIYAYWGCLQVTTL